MRVSIRTMMNGDPLLPPQSAGPPLPITSPTTPTPRDPTHLLASEMVHLKMKLEEKRRAIEAQKKKVSAGRGRRRLAGRTDE